MRGAAARQTLRSDPVRQCRPPPLPRDAGELPPAAALDLRPHRLPALSRPDTAAVACPRRPLRPGGSMTAHHACRLLLRWGLPIAGIGYLAYLFANSDPAPLPEHLQPASSAERRGGEAWGIT